MPRKQFKIVSDSIVKKSKGSRTGVRPVGREIAVFVEDVLQDIGTCCGVDQCAGTISHYAPGDDRVRVYNVLNGFFGPSGSSKFNLPSHKWMITPDSIVTKDATLPAGRARVPFVEDILNQQANCCGTQCCGGFIRLPNHDEGVVYEFGVEAGNTVIAPRVVPNLSPGPRKLKKIYKIIPDSIHKRGKRRLRSGTVRIRNHVHYFEDVQEEMVDVGYYGFDCCQGRIILPDLNVPGDVYEIRIINGAFDLTQIAFCGTPSIPAPFTALITVGSGDDTVPAVGTLNGNFPAGTLINAQATHSITGPWNHTYTVPTGGQSAQQVSSNWAPILSGWTGITVSANGETIEFLDFQGGQTLTLDNFAIV